MSANAYSPEHAEALLAELAGVFFQASAQRHADAAGPSLKDRFKALVDQLPAVVFMADLDEGFGEAYVSPQIEEALGFTQSEWLEDPVMWYRQIHPDDKDRWSEEAALMFLSGKPLRSAYRVLARDGRVVWFQCEARLVRREDGRPWFIHGVGFDITELKQVQEALQEERNVVSAIFDTVGALIVVLDREGRIVRFNRACEQLLGCPLEACQGDLVWERFLAREDAGAFRELFLQIRDASTRTQSESRWIGRGGEERIIAWSASLLAESKHTPTYVITSGIDVTEQKRLEKTILEIGEKERRRIGQDLHDGLGQHLTGVAFMGKVLADKLAQDASPEAAVAAKIVTLVNEAIKMTRDLARGLLPVVSKSHGLISALDLWAREVSELYHISCRFECGDAVLVRENVPADHLYRLAQEAVNNALKHGKAKNIRIRLSASKGGGALTIFDDGCGFEVAAINSRGLGLRIMNYRAKMIGGSIDVQSTPGSGTVVSCLFPVSNGAGQSAG